ncbi:MAG: efflux transporter periplasmic adaptor subunit, partial [Candidatus Omnitrophica bacterium CG12_big_fil_rev_8_21_14_0_65_50_5]
FLVSRNPVKAEFTVPERYSSRIKEGQDVEIQVTAYPGETFSGKVYFIDPRVNDVTRTVLMKAKIPNRDGHLKPGMFANLNLIVNTKSDALVIPETAVMVKGDTTSVFVISENNKASLKLVVLGIRLAGRVEVTQGLREGDVVVVEGFQKLREGADVQVRFEEK